MKKWIKQNRRFLNTPKSGCLGAVSWEVSCYQEKDHALISAARADNMSQEDIKKLPKKWAMDGSMEINRDAQTHYINRKANMRPVYAMQKELNDFVAECEAAIKDVEEGNNAKN